MEVDEIQPGQLLQINRSGGSYLYKFCGQYLDGKITLVTLEWVFTWPRTSDSGYLPSRTMVSTITADQLFDFVIPTDRLMALYADVSSGRVAPAKAR